MDFALPQLRREEVVALRLRTLYEREGYQLYRLGSFEAYDTYLQNKSFLEGEDIITFTGADGRLMALKPDVTLSIAKNTPPGGLRRVYYNESVFRRSRQTGEYREINQMGIECIGGDEMAAQTEVLRLAAQSLAVAGNAVLDLSHMGFIEAMLAPFAGDEWRAQAYEALLAKSPHGMRTAAQGGGLVPAYIQKLEALTQLSGDFKTAMPVAKALACGVNGAQAPLEELEALYAQVQCEAGPEIRLDFSILNDVDYYNGLIFQGFVKGLHRSVLSGGRYDNLLRRFGKTQGAIGFALYLDVLGRADTLQPRALAGPTTDNYLNIALPKGRLGNRVYQLFSQIGYSCEDILGESRRLVFEDADNRVRYFLVKPSDVDSYVEHGAADIGVVGKDVLLESGADVLELLDLKLGACRLAVAAPTGFAENMALPLRVATKYPAVARRYYAAQSRAVEIIKLHGSIELAPLLGLSDVIVDIVETGGTLKENNLAVLCNIAPSSARLVANRAAWRFKGEIIQTLAQKLGEIL